MARKTNPVEVPIENFCCDVFGEDVRLIVVCSNLQHADDAFLHKYLSLMCFAFFEDPCGRRAKGGTRASRACAWAAGGACGSPQTWATGSGRSAARREMGKRTGAFWVWFWFGCKETERNKLQMGQGRGMVVGNRMLGPLSVLWESQGQNGIKERYLVPMSWSKGRLACLGLAGMAMDSEGV